MKYRVKFKCYHYNTGAIDNHTYDNYQDFNTLPEALKFKARVDEQVAMDKKPKISSYQSIGDVSEYARKHGITMHEYNLWLKNFDYIKIENGYILGQARIVKYYPAREEEI